MATFPTEQTLETGQSREPGLAAILKALFSYLQSVWQAIIGQTQPTGFITARLTIAAGASTTLDQATRNTGGDKLADLATAEPTGGFIVNRTGGAYQVELYAATINDATAGVTIKDDESFPLQGVQDLSTISLANSSGGSVTLHILLWGTFATT